jgi:hypothetical protein
MDSLFLCSLPSLLSKIYIVEAEKFLFLLHIGVTKMAVGIVTEINEKSEELNELDFENLMEFLSIEEEKITKEKDETIAVAEPVAIVDELAVDSDLAAAVELAAETVVKAKKEKRVKPEKVKVVKEKTSTDPIEMPRDFYALLKTDLAPEVDMMAVNEITHKLMASMNTKIGAKCANLFSGLNKVGPLSVFVELGLKYILNNSLIEKADFVDYFTKAARNGVKDYEKSTANPQAANLLSLFVTLQMLNKVEGVYAVNENSLLIAKAMELLA